MKTHKLSPCFNFARTWRVLLAAGLLTGLGGCTIQPVTSGGITIDTSLTAQGQDSRAMFLILHYTVADLPISLKVLTGPRVSVHYVVSDEARPRIWRLVDESRRAWHSGASAWKGARLLNASSIGIEIVHPGFKIGPDKQRIYQPFSKTQMDALVPLIRDIVARHQIKPDRILGHGEVTPAYKEDPGPTFPWKKLAELGITPPLPDAAQVAMLTSYYAVLLPDVAWFQERLAQHGYAVERTGLWDKQTERVMLNFQMRYRPANYSGQGDPESAALLHVLTTTAPQP